MIKDDLIHKIVDKNVDVDEFTKLVIDNAKLRDEIVYLMLNNDNIMVYYHSYYIVKNASEIRPELFYSYWNDFASLLKHQNSYHRDFGLALIANLTEVDKENKFTTILKDYYKCIDDTKFMTAGHCIQNSGKILANNKEIKEYILNILLDVDNLCDFPPKQKALIKSNVIEVFDEFYDEIEDKEKINVFVKAQLDSISPKTKKLAKQFILKH